MYSVEGVFNHWIFFFKIVYLCSKLWTFHINEILFPHLKKLIFLLIWFMYLTWSFSWSRYWTSSRGTGAGRRCVWTRTAGAPWRWVVRGWRIYCIFPGKIKYYCDVKIIIPFCIKSSNFFIARVQQKTFVGFHKRHKIREIPLA